MCPSRAFPPKGREAQGSLLKEAVYGFRYIFKRPPLLALQLTFLTGNFLVGVPHAVLAAMILASTGNNEQSLALVSSVGAIGGVVGGLGHERLGRAETARLWRAGRLVHHQPAGDGA